MAGSRHVVLAVRHVRQADAQLAALVTLGVIIFGSLGAFVILAALDFYGRRKR